MQQQADKNKVELQACEKEVAEMEKKIQQYKEQRLRRIVHGRQFPWPRALGMSQNPRYAQLITSVEQIKHQMQQAPRMF